MEDNGVHDQHTKIGEVSKQILIKHHIKFNSTPRDSAPIPQL